MKYGAQSQEPPQQPVSSRSISPTMGSLGLTGLHTGPLGMMQPSGTPTSSVAGSSHEGIPTTAVSTSTPISSAQPAAKPLPKVPVSFVLSHRKRSGFNFLIVCLL